jgi:N-acetylglucosaminyl-diphospho-decaprenol L-rhamnosyltransferase
MINRQRPKETATDLGESDRTRDEASLADEERPVKRVIVIVVGFQCTADILSCLKSLQASTHSAFEIHICENGGSAAFAELIGALSETFGAALPAAATLGGAPRIAETRSDRLAPDGPPIVVHRAESNLGYAGAVNATIRALDRTAWDALWVLNPDTKPEPDALAALLRRASDGDFGVVGSRLAHLEGSIHVLGGCWRPWIGRGFNIGRGEPLSAPVNARMVEAKMNYIVGASMYVTREYVERVGLMSEHYFLYNEDVDWCFRRGGFKLGYAHDSIVFHAHGSTIGSSADKRLRSPLAVYLAERNKLLFTRRFFPLRYPVVATIALAFCGQYLMAGALRNFGFAVRGWIAGLSGEVGIPVWHR